MKKNINSIDDYYEGLARVKLSDDNWNFIDTKGNLLSDNNFKLVDNFETYDFFHKALAVVQLSDGTWYFIDKDLNFYDTNTKTPVPNPFEKELNK